MTLSSFANEVVETKYTVEDANLRVLKILNKLTKDSVKPVDKTSGFNYRYKSHVFSPFRFDIYVGKFTKKSDDSIVRIESTKNGEAKVIRNYLDVELNQSEAEYRFSQKFHAKSHILTQTLNIASPVFSVWYNSYNSPFYSRNDTIIKSVTYFLYDAIILAVAAFYINNSNVGGKGQLDDLLWKKGRQEGLLDAPHGQFVFADLAIPRIYRGIEALSDTAAHNRMAEISYTYRF